MKKNNASCLDRGVSLCGASLAPSAGSGSIWERVGTTSMPALSRLSCTDDGEKS
jgi:hypothetical protein